MRSFQLVLALCTSLTLSATLEKRQDDFFGGGGGGGGSSYSAPLNMDLLGGGGGGDLIGLSGGGGGDLVALADTTIPDITSQPLSTAGDTTISMVQPNIDIGTFTPANDIVTTPPSTAADSTTPQPNTIATTGVVPAGGSTAVVATTDTGNTLGTPGTSPSSPAGTTTPGVTPEAPSTAADSTTPQPNTVATTGVVSSEGSTVVVKANTGSIPGTTGTPGGSSTEVSNQLLAASTTEGDTAKSSDTPGTIGTSGDSSTEVSKKSTSDPPANIGSTVNTAGTGVSSPDTTTVATSPGSDGSYPAYRMALSSLPDPSSTTSSSTGSESQRDPSMFSPDATGKLEATLMQPNSVLSSSTTSTDGTNSGSSGGSSSGTGTYTDSRTGGSTGDSGSLGTTIQGYQRPPTGLQQIPGSSVGSSVNGATSNNPSYRVNQAGYNPATTRPTGPTLTNTLLSNVVAIGSKFLSNLVNGDPNRIAAEAANPYSSSTYLAQYQAQLVAASVRAARSAALARASPVAGSAAYYAAQNNNRVVNGGGVTSAPIPRATLTPAQIREAALKASRLSDYYKKHPSAGIIGTGLYRTPTATTSVPSASITPNSNQVTDPTTGDEGPDTTEYDGSQSDLPDTLPLVTTSGTPSTTCEVTALNSGNCNPNFRNKICDLGCTNNEQAAVSALCQKNACSVGAIDATVNYKAMIPTTGFPLSATTLNGSDLKFCNNPALNAVGDLCYISTGRPVALKTATTDTSSASAVATDQYGTPLPKRRRNVIRSKAVRGGIFPKRRRYAKPWLA